MQKFLSMLFSRRALAIVGVVMLALLIWFIGPLVAFDTMHPLASVGSRVPVRYAACTWLNMPAAGRIFWQAFTASTAPGRTVPGDADPVVHSTHGTQQPAVRGVERL